MWKSCADMAKKTFSNRLFISVAVFIVLILIYVYKLNCAFSVNTDFGRDIFEMQKITEGNLTLMGPMLSAGFYGSPLYFYFYAPLVYLFPGSLIYIVYLNAFIFATIFTMIIYFASKKNNFFQLIVLILAISLLPQTIVSARNPGNAFTYLPILFTLIVFPIFWKVDSKTKLFFLGLGSFLCLSFHPISIFGILPLIVYIFLNYKKKILNLLCFLVPAIASIIPTLLFEIRHNFQISRGFISGLHIGLGNLSFFTKLSENLNFVNSTLFQNFTVLVLLIFAISIYLFSRNRAKFSFYDKFLFLWTISAYFIYILITPKFEPHYLIPLNLLILVSLWISLRISSFKPIFIFFILLIVSQFPVSIFQNSSRPIGRFQKVAQFITTNFPELKKQKVNLIQVSSKEISVPVGHEYRYFLVNQGQSLLAPEEYSITDYLFVISEVPNFDIKKLDNWEIHEFGSNYKIQAQNRVENIDIYLLQK